MQSHIKLFFSILFLMFTTLAFSIQPTFAATRTYYIAAENVVWDFAPSNQDLIHGGPIPAPWTASHIFPKVRFIEYTNSSFSTPKPQPVWLGVIGPIIRAEVGDTIVVNFFNRGSQPYSMHPHGVRYDKNSEGSYHPGIPTGAGGQVAPGASFVYTWKADAGSGPGVAGPSSVVWWYHSHVNETADINAGLLGPIIITRKGQAKADGSPNDVQGEFVNVYMIFNELNGMEAGLMHGINGYIFGNLPGLEMKNGDKVRWHVLGMGNELDLHTPHWHGKTLDFRYQNTDVIELLPGSMASATMLADNPGTWLIHCHVGDHINAGMQAYYKINP